MPPKPKPPAAPYIPPMLPSASAFRCQPRVVELLDRALRRGSLRGALLIMGERGLGKTTLAVAIARALTCERNSGEGGAAQDGFWYCGECYACRSIATFNQPEFTFIRPVTKQIKFEEFEGEEGVVARAYLHPINLSHRIIIIDEAHMLHERGWNSLLKLLEEPPERTVFMLVTDKPHLLLPTIRSRGQRIALSPATLSALTQELARDLPDRPQVVLTEASRMSAGRFVQARGLAESSEWRAAVKALAGALGRGRSYGPEAKELAALELAMSQVETEDDGEGELTKERRNELHRAALIGAYQRAAWWLSCTGQARPGLLTALARLRLRIDSNVDPAIAQAAFEAELWLGAGPIGLAQIQALRA